EGQVEIPEWIKNTKFNGDIRLRYETKGKDNQVSRQRERIRVRLGVETEINKDLKAGIKIAAAGKDPRSTTQSFENTFESKNIVLNQAYIQYKPNENLKITAGKFEKPFFAADQLVWDSDLCFEGQAVSLNKDMSDKLNLFVNAGLFVLDENANTSKDPLMYYIQPGFKQKVGEKMLWEFAAGYFGFSDVRGNTLDYSSNSNSIENGGLKYNFNSINLVSKLTYSWQDTKKDDYAMSFVSDYIENFDSGDNGYLLGINYGFKQLKKRGAWQLFYNWRKLERDAFLDVFPSSECYSGKTNIQGHELGAAYVLLENVVLSLDYYYTEDIDNTDIEEHLFTADLLVKF
ncbi:putative porin, partial [bacterium]|nr:putative porin [bacterium]